jgi:hypothetical protein
MATIQTETALDRFITKTRDLFAAETDPERRWAALAPVLSELLADADIQAASKHWPACHVTDRAENLLFYEDADYGFVINALKRLPGETPGVNPEHPTWRGIHDHAHIYTLYGVLVGNEIIERYERLDDGSKEGFCEIKKSGDFKVQPGSVDLVTPYEIHAERSLGQETVAVIIRSEKSGGFLQGRYDPDTNQYWQGYGPRQTPVDMFADSN